MENDRELDRVQRIGNSRIHVVRNSQVYSDPAVDMEQENIAIIYTPIREVYRQPRSIPMEEKRTFHSPAHPFFASFPPQWAAALRAFVWAIVIAVGQGAYDYFNGQPVLPEGSEWLAPIMVLILRGLIEGRLDKNGAENRDSELAEEHHG